MKTKVAIILENDAGKEIERFVDAVSDPDDITKVVLYIVKEYDWVIGVGDRLRIEATE